MSKEWQDRLAELLKDKNTLHNTTTTLPARDAHTHPLRENNNALKIQTHQNPTVKTAKTPEAKLCFSESGRNPTAKTAKTLDGGIQKTKTDQNLTAKTAKTTEAERLGLVATWSIEFGYISLHDPTTGEWHDLKTEEAPDWAKREAFKRKELYRDGNRKAYRLTARELAKIWESEYVSESEGIVEDHPIEEEDE